MEQIVMVAKRFPLKLWAYLREASGEDDYLRYVERLSANRQPTLSPRDFYLEKLRHKYSRPCRCC